ncbi:MAG: thioredoxin family protein [Alloprevotella sp.]|nr:thioredoxin family protein [Alloprevotella sp.]
MLKLKSFLIVLALSLMPLAAQVDFSVAYKRVSPELIDIVFNATIQRGWHVYGTNVADGGPTRASFNVDASEGVSLEGPLRGGAGVVQAYDPNFGMDVSWYENRAQFTQRVRLNKPDYRLNGYLEWGACNNQTCLPPSSTDCSLSGTDGPAEKAADKEDTAKDRAADAAKDETAVADSLTAVGDTLSALAALSDASAPRDRWYAPVVDQLRAFGESSDTKGRSLLYILLMGFLGGFIALFTPCVWPIIPMTVSFFLHRSDNRRKAVRDAVLYGLSIIVIYVGLGLLLTAFMGANALNDLSTNAIFNLFLFALLVVFAASFLGGFELTLPSSWSNKVDARASSATGLLSIFLMALTLVLVSFSCTGPIIGFLLVEVSTGGGSSLAPTLGMLGFAAALALPFTLFALFPTWIKKAPKSGGWMNVVKVVLGFIELAFALKFLSVADLAYGWHLLDRETFLSLWIVLFALLGVYLLGWLRFPHDDKSEHTSIPRFFMGLCSLAFAIYMLPGLWGAPLKAVSAFAPPLRTQDFNLDPVKVEPKFKDFELGMAYAQQAGKPVLIDFTGHGCVNCRKMELAVWHDPVVRDLINNEFVLISLYVDDKTRLAVPDTIELNGKTRVLRTVGDKWSVLQEKKFGTNSQPFYIPVDNDGRVLNHSFAYKEDVAAYVRFLQEALARYRGEQP